MRRDIRNMNMNRSSTHQLPTLLFIVLALASTGLNAGSTDHERHIALEGQSNFRDLGGYATEDGKTIRWGQVFRSGELQDLTDNDVAKLDELGIEKVVNFLTEREIQGRGEDRLPEGVEQIPLPMQAGNLGPLLGVVLDARKTGDFSKVPVEVNPQIHRSLIDEAGDYYASFLREAADPQNRPLVFHCSHGIHRTGTAAAILLSALGVPWETIREDYLLSNTYRAEEIEMRVGQLRDLYAQNNGLKPEDVDTTNIEAFYVLDGSYIDAALDEAVMKYGSMDAYIREGLGITDAEIQSLRDQLLE